MIARFRAAVAERAQLPDGLALAGWSEADWSALFEAADTLALRNGEILIERDAAGMDLFFVVGGRLDVTIPQRDSHVLTPPWQILPGSVVGEIAFFDGGRRSATVWASGPCDLFRLPRHGFEAFTAARPDLAVDLLAAIARLMAGRLRRAQGDTDGTAQGRRRAVF